jgi:hypothetical protein
MTGTFHVMTMRTVSFSISDAPPTVLGFFITAAAPPKLARLGPSRR